MNEKLGRRSSQPDMVFLASALWDNMRWLKEDIAQGKDMKAIVSMWVFVVPSMISVIRTKPRRERINWYRDRVQQVAERAADLFPRTPIRWIGNSFRE